jgi:transketolase
LGEGLSYANGMALAGRILGLSYSVYCLLGDGELQEGQVWEAMMTAAKHCLGNIVAIVDCNRLKAMDETVCSKELEPLATRWTSFGWAATEIDGHNMEAICDALDWADEQVAQPSVIIANTVKGKGISFVEGRPQYHNASLGEPEFEKAMSEVEAAFAVAEDA